MSRKFKGDRTSEHRPSSGLSRFHFCIRDICRWLFWSQCGQVPQKSLFPSRKFKGDRTRATQNIICFLSSSLQSLTADLSLMYFPVFLESARQTDCTNRGDHDAAQLRHHTNAVDREKLREYVAVL